MLLLIGGGNFVQGQNTSAEPRERILLNEDWKFFKYDSAAEVDSLIYDVRPQFEDDEDGKDADAKPTEAEEITGEAKVLKPWILPTGNKFLKDGEDKHSRPRGEPFPDFPFIQPDYNDGDWESIDLPHDWAIKGPFFEGEDAEVGGGMGRLPSPGVGWYRKSIEISEADLKKQIFLEIDGAMSYAMVWLNGKIVGGWPYGYASWQVDLTTYLKSGENQLAIRVDNPPASSRWYPGGGIYQNVWLTKKNPINIAKWGTFVTGENITENSAGINLNLFIDNVSNNDAEISVENKLYELNENGGRKNAITAEFDEVKLNLNANSTEILKDKINIQNPKLWGPPPSQKPSI
ncbi:beta galactosidase jelly roll domain-containing protein [Salegentibacter sp. LM13S]|uniref:sugar-binding domain-containing protein n=1 Tax=Salegentibacter lacus TaxID=2873599 RepID=UPI001CCF9E3B|nr:sugar-binding domain-containing protein [Salegentibacter lacus]MBZ9630282.1 beta galactosidase jelly roll domain-containing protein [Salegentibacter lacus]